jgi:hypothetical protein
LGQRANGERPDASEELFGVRLVRVLLLLAAFAAGPGALVWADQQGVSGIVKDALGRPLQLVRVSLRTLRGEEIAHTVSNADGRFELRASRPGVYALVASRKGFKPAIKIVTFPTEKNETFAIVLESEQALTVQIKEHVSHAQNGLSDTGANKYNMTERDINNLPQGDYTTITDVLLQMPGVSLDQNQQIHIRGTEGPQFQYRINGIMLPLDINTNPPFISNINSFFIKKVSLLDGILPANYSYATGGIVDIQTKDGCEDRQSDFSLYGGQRETAQPSFQLAGCHGKFSYYMSGLFTHDNLAFSSATPAPDPIHDLTNQGQGFGFFAYNLTPTTRLSLITSMSLSNNQLPNQLNQAPEYQLAGVSYYPSAAINSYLNFRDYFGILALNGSPTSRLSYDLAYTAHYIVQKFNPDPIGELIYEGVASTAFHSDLDNILQGDVTYQLGSSHTLASGFYFGEYGVQVDDSSLVFPVNSQGQQTSTVPVRVTNNANKLNFLGGAYIEDTWQISEKLRANYGVRWDQLSGFTNNGQFDPDINLLYRLRPDTELHGGFARYFQIPLFQGISPGAPASFAGTTAASPVPGIALPETEDDFEWDAGVVRHLTPRITISQDGYYEITRNYLDTGQFGVVPIFSPFNFVTGHMWGTESSVSYNTENLSVRLNLTIGRSVQKGVATGQFNFDLAELNYINSHYIVLDHEPLYGASGGIAYRWRGYNFGLDGIYSSGLRAGFADTEQLPQVWQWNLSVTRSFLAPVLGQVTQRLVLINIFDRTNLIRPAEGIGIFQAAYGPRIAVYDEMTVPLPSF